MARMPFWCIWLVCVGLCLGWAAGCGDPNVCSNDTDCKDGKICLHEVCSVKPADDAGDKEPAAEKIPDTAEPDVRTTPDVPVKPDERTTPDVPVKPDERTTPDKPQAQVGIRAEGDVCDPREFAYFYDRCAPGLGCAEYAQTAPSSGAPQPYGICLKACDINDKSSCPAETVCAQTSDTKTRQPTGIFVCGRKAGEGDLCVNTDACTDGLSCIKFGTTGTNWTCQTECTTDASVCATNYKCLPQETGSQIRICKRIGKAGDVCSDSVTCDEQSYCFEGNRYGAFSQICRKRCTAATDCDATEACQGILVNGVRLASVCLKKASTGDECNRGFSCESGSQCFDLSTSYAACFKLCNSNADCTSPLVCANATAQTSTKVCKEQLQGGDPVQNLGDCAPGTRGIQLATGVVICLPNCSLGTGTNAALCGKLTPGILRGITLHPTRNLLTVGELGVYAGSSNGGNNWLRAPFPTKVDLSGISTSSDGVVLLVSGVRGTIVRSEDSAATWSLVTSGTDQNLAGIALSSDGTTALAVGAAGTILRSEDGGKTWAAVTLTPALTESLTAVSFARDSGTGTSTPLAFAVGTAGTVLRSEDAGKTWAPVTGITTNLNALSLLHDRTATGLFGVITGFKGEIWTSSDEGKTWSQETSNVTIALRAAHHDGTTTLVAGDGGTILQRDQAGAWTKLATNSTLAIYAIAVKAQQWTAVGNLGSSIRSIDDGKIWAETLTSALQCVGLSSGGNPSGGVCLFRCETLANGGDCPFGLNQCSALSLGNSTVNVCFPPTAVTGTAGAGEPCNTYATSPASLHCKEDHVCGFLGTGFFCLRRCNDTLKCDAGDSCLRDNTLQSTFCGKSVAKGQVCDLSKNMFCEPGHTCELNRLNGISTCVAVPVAKETETCDAERRPCAAGLICSGLSSTPYRRFCTKLCTPGGSPTGCSSGWDCLQTSPGNGICVERCASAAHVCQVKHVRCQVVTSTGNAHCI